MPCLITLSSGVVIVPDTYSVATHKASAEATDKPVEDGATISDHVIVKPRMLNVSMIVSPFSAESTPPAYPGPGLDRPEVFYFLLLEQLTSGEPMIVEVDGETYAPAIAQELEWSHVYDDGLSRRITLEIKRILITTAQTVPAAQVATNIKHKTKTMDLGKLQTARANARTEAVVQAAQGRYIQATILALGSVL